MPEVRAVGATVAVGVQPLDQPVGLRGRGVEQREDVADRGVAILQLLQVLGASACGRRGCRCSSARCRRGRSPCRRPSRARRSGRLSDRCTRVDSSSVLAWTRSTSRASVSGGVVGQHAVAQVEDVAVAAPGALAAPARPCARPTSHGASSTAGSRLPCTATLAEPPTRCHASSSGVRQSMPITSPPASRISGSSSPVPTPKWITGTSRSVSAVEQPAHVRQHAACGSRRRRARRPTSRTPAAPARRRRPGRAGAAATIATSARIRASHVAGSPSISAFVRSWLRRRPALHQVARQRERRTGEPDQRHGELLAQQPDRLEHLGHVLLGLERAEPREVVGDADGRVDDRTAAGLDPHVDPHAGERHHDVAEHDRGVERPCAAAAAA